MKAAGAGFVAAVLAILTAHQGMVLVLTRFELLGVPAGIPVWNLDPNAFGVPVLVSQCVFGGLYGIGFALLAPGRVPLWLGGLLTGIAAALVGLFIVGPLKGGPVAGGWDLLAWARPLLVNGVFGVVLGWAYPVVRNRF